MASGMKETVVATLRVSTSGASFAPISARVSRFTRSTSAPGAAPPGRSSTNVVATAGSQ